MWGLGFETKALSPELSPKLNPKLNPQLNPKLNGVSRSASSNFPQPTNPSVFYSRNLKSLTLKS